MKQTIIIIILFSTLFTSCRQTNNDVKLRLKWSYQAQFAGYIVAKEKGMYKSHGLNVDVQPAGPDLLPYKTVASGADDIGIGIISQIISARSNNVPLVVVAQEFQNSPNRFVLKNENRIDSLQQLRGKKVGLWMSGDEIEFISMLKTVGMTDKDITIVPQKFSITPFLHDEYVCSQVMVYNELLQIENNGYPKDKLQILSPRDYNSAILGDLIFTNEKFLKEHRETMKEFLIASFEGWKYVKQHPDEAIQIVLKYNPELNAAEQKQQLQAILALISDGNTTVRGIGYIPVQDYENAKRILLNAQDTLKEEYKKLKTVNVAACYDSTIWSSIPLNNKLFN